jgi:hypothetical protein
MSDAEEPAEDRAVRIALDNWQALGVEEHNEVLHLPATLKRRTKNGDLKEVDVRLRNVTNQQRFRARIQARALAAELKLDLDRDKDYLDDLENYSILAFAIRDPGTFDQHVIDAKALLDTYDWQTLSEVWGRYDAWVEMLDPRFGELDGEQLWQTIVRIAGEKTPAPLVGMVGPAQYSCIVLMAEEALRSPNAPSWVQPSPTSPLDSSPPTNSETS